MEELPERRNGHQRSLLPRVAVRSYRRDQLCSAANQGLCRILRRDADGGPVVTLDYESTFSPSPPRSHRDRNADHLPHPGASGTDGKVFIEDIVRGCKLCNGIWRRTHDWFAQTIMHDLKITYGVNGSIDYSAYIAPSTKNAFFRYTSTNRDMGSSASLKVISLATSSSAVWV